MKLCMLIPILMLAETFVSAELTLSKDSLWVSNSSVFSRDDEVIFVNNSDETVLLDSASVEFDVLDTVGISHMIINDLLEIAFSECHGLADPLNLNIWSLEYCGNNRYRLKLGGSSVRPLSPIPPQDTLIIRRMQVGGCFICDRMPLYPNYLRGTLHFYFGNGSEVSITLYSADLRKVETGIVISKDSLKVYNNPLSSIADGVRFVAGGVSPVRLDSATLTFEVFDTTGSGRDGLEGRLQVRWKTGLTPMEYIYWDLEPTGHNQYRMVLHQSTSSDPVTPLAFSAPLDSEYISMMEIGTCLNCSGLPPWHPAYLSGVMELRFTKGETVKIRLYAEDLRTFTTTSPAKRVVNKSGTLINAIHQEPHTLTIRTGPEVHTVRLFDASGRCAAKVSVPMGAVSGYEKRFTIPTGRLQPGCFWLSVTSDDRRTDLSRVLLHH